MGIILADTHYELTEIELPKLTVENRPSPEREIEQMS